MRDNKHLGCFWPVVRQSVGADGELQPTHVEHARMHCTYDINVCYLDPALHIVRKHVRALQLLEHLQEQYAAMPVTHREWQ